MKRIECVVFFFVPTKDDSKPFAAFLIQLHLFNRQRKKNKYFYNQKHKYINYVPIGQPAVICCVSNKVVGRSIYKWSIDVRKIIGGTNN